MAGFSPGALERWPQIGKGSRGGGICLGLCFQCGRWCWHWKCASSGPKHKWKDSFFSKEIPPDLLENPSLLFPHRDKHRWTVTLSWVMATPSFAGCTMLEHKCTHWADRTQLAWRGKGTPTPTLFQKEAEPSSALLAELLSGKSLNLSEPQKWKK